MKKKILVVIPFYNEFSALKKMKLQIKSNFDKYDFLMINDKSDDNSEKLFRLKRFLTLHNKQRMGIGYSLKKGIKYACDNHYDICVFMSGNGKMKISDIKKMVKPILLKNYDYINGSRFLKYNKKSNTPKFRYLSIKILSFLLSILYNKKITDFSCGFRAFKTKKFFKFTQIKSTNLFNTYGFEYYLYAKVCLSNIRAREVSITMWYPNKNLKKKYSKITPFIDWYKMLIPWLISYIDRKKFFN